MTLIAAILATTLSLSSTNEYEFLIPQSTNLTGKTFIPEGSLVPRYEDIAFLREAYAERNEAIGASWTQVTVPDSLALTAGSFGGYFLPEEWFSPSFGHWYGITPWQTGFFIRPGISVRPLWQETGPNYLWNAGGELIDTSITNSIRAFVDPQTVVFPTNGLIAATLAGAPRTNAMQLAYAILTNDMVVLSTDASELHRNIWSFAEKQIWGSRQWNRHIIAYNTAEYTYKDEYGRTRTGTYYVGYTLDNGEEKTYTFTNSAPLKSTWERSVSSGTVTRPYSYRRNDYGSEKRYTRISLPDYYSSEAHPYSVNFNGNLSAMSLCLDARLTNTIESVRCVVVMRFQVKLGEYTSGYSAVTNDWSTNRYFVIAWDGDSSRYDRHPVEGGRVVWNTGVPIMELLTQFWQGMDFDNWRAQFPEPKLAPEQDDQTDSRPGSVTASSARYAELTIDSILPYFIIKRKWNARIEND